MNREQKRKHIEAVRETAAHKIVVKAKRRVRQMTCDHPCQCRDNINLTLSAIIKFGTDVFERRPEFYVALVILGDAIQEMASEADKIQSNEVIYL